MYKRISRAIFLSCALFSLYLYCIQISNVETIQLDTDTIPTVEFTSTEQDVEEEVSIVPNKTPITASSYDTYYGKALQDGTIFYENTIVSDSPDLLLLNCHGIRYINAIFTPILDFPIESADAVETVSLNTQVELLSRTSDNYYKIKIGDIEGFIHEDYLSETKINYVTNLQNKVANIAKNNQGTRPCEAGLCAAWVSGIYQAAGMGYPGGNAIDYWTRWSWSGSTSMENIPIGAVVVGSGSGSEAGNKYGHVGIYIGNGLVADNPGYHRIIRLEDWAKKQRGYCNGYHGYIGWVWPYGDALGDGI